jgi:hypothetical protein
MNQPVHFLRLSVLCAIVLITAACQLAFLIASCSSASSPGISEISLRNGGGQLAYWYQIVLRKDGTAQYLGDVSPERRRESEPFGNALDKGVERVKYRGRISQEQFSELERLITENGFFSLKDNYGGVSGAIQTTTSVVYSGGRKEVNNQIGQGGEKLSEIERTINRVADQIAWTKVGN